MGSEMLKLHLDMSNFWEGFFKLIILRWTLNLACHGKGVSALMVGHAGIGTVIAGVASVPELKLPSRESAQRQLCSLLLDPREWVHGQHGQRVCCRGSEAHSGALEEEHAGQLV